MIARPLAFSLAALVAGCCGMCAETTKSENVRTEGMRAAVRVSARGDGKTLVSMELRAGGPLSNLFPVVSGADRIEAVSGAETVPLVFAKNVIATPAYTGTLSGDAAGRVVEVRFHRTGNTSALGTRVTLPPPFNITSPPAKLSAAKPTLAMTWTPTAPATMAWSIEGECIEQQRGSLNPDPGRLEVKIEPASAKDGGASPKRCEVKIKLARELNGTLDPAYGEGGSIIAAQEREQVIDFTP